MTTTGAKTATTTKPTRNDKNKYAEHSHPLQSKNDVVNTLRSPCHGEFHSESQKKKTPNATLALFHIPRQTDRMTSSRDVFAT